LGHIVEASGVGARIDLETLPVSTALATHADRPVDYVLAGGDDYELCFCVPRERREQLESLADVAVIGEIVPGSGVEVTDSTGTPYRCRRRGFEHFSGNHS